MKDKEIYSREWCDQLFADRNRAYGAYELRRTIGHRYAIVFRALAAIFLVFIVMILAASYYLYTQVKDVNDELEQISHMQQLRPMKDDNVKKLAQGRRTTPNMKPGATMSKPEIVEGITLMLPIGNDGPESALQIEDELMMLNKDTTHRQSPDDLPEEGVHLLEVDQVEEMPLFPGGNGALMKWLDAHIIYTAASIRDKTEGDMEVTFIVDKQGQVREPKVTKSLTPSLDRNALGALQQMPRWTPGRSKGKATAVQLTLPIHFQMK